MLFASVRSDIPIASRLLVVTRQKEPDLFLVLPTRLVPSAKPFSYLLRIAAHFETELFQGQSVDLFVPCQSFHDIFRTGDGIVSEEGDDWGDEPEIDGPPMLPVPDGGGSHANLNSDIFLVKPEFEAAPSQVVAESDEFLSQLGT